MPVCQAANPGNKLVDATFKIVDATLDATFIGPSEGWSGLVRAAHFSKTVDLGQHETPVFTEELCMSGQRAWEK
jgi:hypothetical protein